MAIILPKVQEHFPKDSRLEVVLRYFLPAFDVTYTSISRYRKSTTHTKYVFMKPEQPFKEGFGFEREILCIFSEKDDFQAKDAEIVDIIYNENKARVDPFVCILLSECDEINEKIDKLTYKDPDNICIVPFSIPWLLKNKPQISDIRTIFQNYMYARDLFSFESPIKKDISFFGREDILLLFIDRFRQGQNSGLFGLRKIGKTSVLYAIERRIKSKNIGGTLYFDCTNPSFYKSRWFKCLQTLIQHLVKEMNIPYSLKINALNLDYDEQNAAAYFEEDVLIIMEKENVERILLMLDEIEWISFNTSSEQHWGNDFLPFWQTLRSIHQNSNGKFCFIISGVNPKCIEEEAVMGYDNPLFALLNPTFLKPFDIDTTRKMVRKLGRYMGIKFEESLYPKLYGLYGGHPFLVRHACSKLCNYEPSRPLTFNLEMFDLHSNKINSSLMPYVKQILNILAIWYPDEYQQIIELAQGNYESVRKYIENEPEYIEHLLGYGIVNYIDGIPKLSIFLMSKQLKKETARSSDPLFEYDESNTNLDDIYAEVSIRRNMIEHKLRILLKQSLKLFHGKNCMGELFKAIPSTRADGLNRYSYEDVWDQLYFIDLIQIIDKNWTLLQKWFSRNKNDVMIWLNHINDYRIDAHAKKISESDLIYLRVAFTRLEENLITIE